MIQSTEQSDRLERIEENQTRQLYKEAASKNHSRQFGYVDDSPHSRSNQFPAEMTVVFLFIVALFVAIYLQLTRERSSGLHKNKLQN